MARNKYPEITVDRILDAAQKLFLEKGYDQTTIQDIVDELGDLSKGAIYHHFKSKEYIMDAVIERMYQGNNPFLQLEDYHGLNGMQKVRQLLTLSLTNLEQMKMFRGALSLLKNPWFLAKQIEEIITENAPVLSRIIEQGIADGSIETDYPEELAETSLLLLNIWLSPALLSVGEEQFLRKERFLSEMMAKIGLPIIDDSVIEKLHEFYRILNTKPENER